MIAPDLSAIATMAHTALDNLPPAFRLLARDVLIDVADWPDADMLAELGIDDPSELTGLYDGIPLTEKMPSDPQPWPDRIWLFREPILAEWRNRGNVDLPYLVAHVMVHELAHHFGWSDDDIARIDRWWE